MLRAMTITLLCVITGTAVYAAIVAVLPAVVQTGALAAGVPSTINHQGVVMVDGVRFTGTGAFKFAILDPDSGLNRWTNNGSNVDTTGAPTASVSLTVNDGVYSVRLGDTSLTNMSSSISPNIFSDDNLRLRIWFDDGVNGVHQLTPDFPLTTSAYTFSVADGAISSSKLAEGSVTAAKLAAGVGIPVGAVMPFAGSSAPTGWLLCDGSAVSRATYAALFSTIGTTYGAGDGSTTFNLPDLRGRVSMGAGTGAGGGASGSGLPTGGSALSSRVAGAWGGEEMHTLTVNEIPAHTHGGPDANDRNIVVGGGVGNPSGLSQTGGPAFRVTTALQSVGGGAAHNVVQPFMVMNQIIKY